MTGRRLTAVPDTARRGVGLVRVSHVGDRGDDLTSPQLQREAITRYAAARGITVVDWVEALDESGSSARSPWWRRLDQQVARVEAGDVNVLLTWKVSRAARHRRRWAVALDRVEVAGGTIESATEGYDPTTSTGRLTRGLLSELAAWEAEVRGEGWRETHARRAAEGLPHAGYPRLGYRRAGKGYEPDPVTGPLVTEAYTRYLAGQSHRTILTWLTVRGMVSARTGRPWTVRGLRYAMDSGFAAGQIHTGGYPDPRTGRPTPDRWVPGAHPALVNAATWDRYQRSRYLRGQGQPARRTAPSTALSGLVRCAGCGQSMRTKQAHPSQRATRPGPYLFACETPGCMSRGYVTVARAMVEVLAWLRPLAVDIDERAAALAADQAHRVTNRADGQRLGRQRADVARRLLDLARDRLSGAIDEETHAALHPELIEARTVLDTELARLADAAQQRRPSARHTQGLLAAWDTLDDVARREALRGFGVTVTVGRGGQRGRGQPTVLVRGGWQ